MMIEISIEQYIDMASRLAELEWRLGEAVQVVQCRDCRHSRVYQTDSNGTMQTYCVAFVMLRSVTDDDFCSWGERREP